MATAVNDLEALKDLDFWTFYSSLCVINKVCPLRSVIRHLKGTELCCPVEAVRSEHWKFLLEALSINNSLTQVNFRSNTYHSRDQIGPLPPKQRKRKSEKGFPIPYGLQARNLSEICRSLSSCLNTSNVLKVLKLEHLPLKLEDIELLSVGLKTSKLNHLSFSGCPLSDEAIQELCDSLKTVLVEWIDFSSCNLSVEGVKHISELIKCHSVRRRSETWPATLRYRFPVLDNLKGLSRITLNDNACIDDDAAQVLADCLMDDLWIKALDLQKCHITDEGASSLLKVLTFNCVLEVLDLQWNFISDDILLRIMMQLELNNADKSLKYEKLPMHFEEKKIKKLPKRNTTLKVKTIKKNPVRIRPVKTTIPKRFLVKEAISQLKCDKGTLTDANYFFEQNSYENVQTNSHSVLTQKYLSCLAHAKKQQQHLLKKLKELTLENHYLRDAMQKQTIPEGMVLIDNDTYSSVKETFEKLENFLAAMKENGWVSLKEADANAIRNFIFDDPKIKSLKSSETTMEEVDCIKEYESSEIKSSEVPGQSKSSASPMSYVRTKGQTTNKPDREMCTCENTKHKEPCNSQKQNFIPQDTKAVTSVGRSTSTEEERLKTVPNKKNLPIRPLDRTLVRKIFECMQRIHNSPNYSGSGKPSCSSELPKKFVVQTVRSKQIPDGHVNKAAMKQKGRIDGSECIHHHKQLQTCSREAGLPRPNLKTKASNSLPTNISEITNDLSDTRENSQNSNKVGIRKNSVDSQEDSSQTLKKDRKIKVDMASQSLPTMTFDNSTLSANAKQLKGQSLSKTHRHNTALTKNFNDQNVFHGKELQFSSSEKALSSSDLSQLTANQKSNSGQNSSSSKKSRSKSSFVIPDSIEQSQIKRKSKLSYTSISSCEIYSDKNSAQSYLESVDSDESTDRDVKSLPDMDISPIHSQKSQKLDSSSVSKIQDKNEAARRWLQNEGGNAANFVEETVKSSSDDSDISNSNESKTLPNKVSEQYVAQKGGKLSAQSKLKKGELDEDVFVPSLSDITTVSTRSINTNSIMYELSESDKV